ncbi:MAG TPA: ATP-binding protein [Rugosimonospora sp.]|nr:ATP-binding protein [Rugosimonospora sp.]
MAAATTGAERLFAVVVAALRVGTLLPVPAALAALAGTPRLVPTAWIAAFATVESVAVALLYLRTGVPRRTWIVLDLLAVAAVLVLSAGPPLLPGPTTESPLYNLALSAAIVAGLVDWAWWAAAAATVPLVAATLAPLALAAHPAYPVWAAVPDGFAFPFAALVAWPVGALIRRSAREYDEHQALSLRRAEMLARERERARHGQALRAQLLGTLETAVATDAVTDPVLAGQLRQETRWLRRVVEVGLADPPPELARGLRELAVEKSLAGLRVTVQVPESIPPLRPEVRQALLDAAREALTNVGKHAGVPDATLRVLVEPDGVTVEVLDRGRGYDPVSSPPGTGQSGSILGRLIEVDGTATVDSTVGRGTRVALHVPVDPP